VRMERYSAYNMANIVNGCCLMQYREEAFLVRICQELSKDENIQALSPGGISLATLALCRLQFYDSRFFSACLRECTTPQKIATVRPGTLIDVMFGCVRADVIHFVQFMEIIKTLREPRKLAYLLNFPFVRLVSIAAILGLRDELLLKGLKEEVLNESRRRSFSYVEQRDVARAFERLGMYDDDLCAALNYGRRVKGQSVGILAPGGLRQIERDERVREIETRREDSNLDWSGQMRPTFYRP